MGVVAQCRAPGSVMKRHRVGESSIAVENKRVKLCVWQGWAPKSLFLHGASLGVPLENAKPSRKKDPANPWARTQLQELQLI